MTQDTITLALDSFKGSIGAGPLGDAVGRGLRAEFPDKQVVNFPCSDGGDGFAQSVGHHFEARRVECTVSDPLSRPRTAHYIWSPADRLAIIESAQANGLDLLNDAERDPLRTTTCGVGELLLDAQRRGAGRIIIGVGGSATVDGGIGMAQALGWRFNTPDGRHLGPQMAGFEPPATIVPPQPHPLDAVRIEVACDVRTRLLGPKEESAVWIYGPQKGGTEDSLALIEQHLTRLDASISEQLGLEYGRLEAGGAAGGLAAGLAVFAGARLRNGMELFDEMAGLQAQIERSALVITGEGRLDAQSAEGKVVSHVSAACRAARVPVIALCGSVGEHTLPLDAVVALTDSALTAEQCIARPIDALDAVFPRLVTAVKSSVISHQ